MVWENVCLLLHSMPCAGLLCTMLCTQLLRDTLS